MSVSVEEKISKIFEDKKFEFKEKYGNCYVYFYKDFKVYCFFNYSTEELSFRHNGKKYFDSLEELIEYYKKRTALEIKSKEKAIQNYNSLLQQINEIKE